MTTFKFIGVNDTGANSGAHCPHCGAEGRYIYEWEENGTPRAAMAGCYKALTGKLEKGDEVRFYEILNEKVAKNKTLNGWEKSVLRMQTFLKEGKYTPEWIEGKIRDILSQRKMFLAKKYH